MITLGKRGDLHARRQAAALFVTKLHQKTMMKSRKYTSNYCSSKIILNLAPRYAEQQRWIYSYLKTEPRGDAAPQWQSLN